MGATKGEFVLVTLGIFTGLFVFFLLLGIRRSLKLLVRSLFAVVLAGLLIACYLVVRLVVG
jgi:uncharacterized membrane protein YgaE (UPF0421/DUF939 family)